MPHRGLKHEGKILLALLEEHKNTVQDLANAARVEWPSAQKYVNAERIGARAWVTCSVGLVRLGIDPARIRSYVPPEAVAAAQEMHRAQSGVTQAPLPPPPQPSVMPDGGRPFIMDEASEHELAAMTPQQLTLLRRILEAPASHAEVRGYVRALLRR